ncbi:hypothetical protein LCGC14_0196220 [marine sediment metagenome]|uniref:Uncharacterized protein n=1 Tax=marine sediment metagenome TaxID=412755 RepID=A0A0F9UQ68_9ZZZZ
MSTIDVERRIKSLQEIGKDLSLELIIFLFGLWWLYVGSLIGFIFLSYSLAAIVGYFVFKKYLGLYTIKYAESDEPCEDENCEEYHCTKCDRHFTGSNPQMKDDEIECLHCFELEQDCG